jgi:hypothetical protein
VAELATLKISYGSAWRSRATNAVLIEVDGREVGRLRNGQNLVTHVESGRRNLRARQWTSPGVPLELDLAPGEEVQLEIKMVGANRLTLIRADEAAAVSPEPPAAPQVAQVLGVTETHRSEEPIGTETRRIDNTSGPARVTRTMRVTREWSRTVSLDHTSSDGTSTGAQVGPDWLALRTSVEQSLSQTYSVSTGRREEFVEEISVEVDPGTAVTVVLAWKRLWQHGVVHVLSGGSPVEVPFRLAVGITYDQSMT